MKTYYKKENTMFAFKLCWISDGILEKFRDNLKQKREIKIQNSIYPTQNGIYHQYFSCFISSFELILSGFVECESAQISSTLSHIVSIKGRPKSIQLNQNDKPRRGLKRFYSKQCHSIRAILIVVVTTNNKLLP